MIKELKYIREIKNGKCEVVIASKHHSKILAATNNKGEIDIQIPAGFHIVGYLQ